MSEYISSYVIDPLARQARRLSQISQNNLNDSLVLAESFSRWSPGRLWSNSPLEEVEDGEAEDGSQPVAQHGIGPQWTRFWRSEDVLMQSPTLEPMNTDIVQEPDQLDQEIPFPVLDSQPPATLSPPPFERPHRTDSELSFNPLNELSERSRIHQEDLAGVHSLPDPLTRPNQGQNPFIDGVDELYGDDVHRAAHRSRDGSGTLPEDDGMAPIRNKIKAIWKGEGSSSAKSRMIHHLMMERYNASHIHASSSGPLTSPKSFDVRGEPLTPPPSSPGMVPVAMAQSPPGSQIGSETCQLSPSDTERTFAPPRSQESGKDEDTGVREDQEATLSEEPPRMGCRHYIRNVKPQCNTCLHFFPCRICHDEAVKDHVLPRHATRNMLCMECLTPQPAAQYCRNCGTCAGTYFCSVCKLWNSDPDKSIYHCDDCGICRLGQGLGKDFYHCPVCAVCISINVALTHRCIEQSTKCDCPICGEYMFTSPETVVFMRCGHSIHEACFKDWCRAAYKCPICSKSVVNMESQFRRLDRHIASQPMPEEYRETKAIVHCNDCLNKSIVPFHWLGLRCEHCEGYNTTQIDLIGAPSLEEHQPPDAEVLMPQEDSAGEALANAMAQRAAIIASTQRPTTALSEIAAAATSPTLIPYSRGARSVSPGISNYFGTGGQSPRSQSSFAFVEREDGHESDSDASMDDEEDDDDDDDEDGEDDIEDDDDDDHIVLFGHR